MVAAQLAIEYPDDMVEVVEHWTASVLDDEHFDAVTIVDGEPKWQRIPTGKPVNRLGPQLLDAGGAGGER